ncbi:MAG: sigma-70 family RNA polymerase sigma factor [Acidobacteriota bacterium]|nr:sigma-70 family RNA polymerase sigma factor [Acidobacteriota bacterium]
MTKTREKTAPEPLLPRVAAGDAQAVEECIDRYKGLIWWTARRIIGADAEDAVQEIFIELWSSAHRYDPARSSEPAFVTMIARRRLIDRRRKAGRRPTESSLTTDDGELPVRAPQTVEASAEASLARRAIEQLDPKERDAVTLSVVYGMSHSEIADHTELPLGTVKTYIRRGLQRVRDVLLFRQPSAEEAAS